MAETFQEYTDRIGSYVAGKDPMAILRKTPKTLARAFAAAPRRRLTARPASGKWSAGEILAHLSELEMLWGCRLRLILGQTGVPIVGMDQDVWAKNSAYRTIDPRRALAAFLAIRQANLDLLGRLTPAQRRRWGAHSQFGRLTVTRLMQLLAGHDVNHVRQVLERLAPGKKRRSAWTVGSAAPARRAINQSSRRRGAQSISRRPRRRRPGRAPSGRAAASRRPRLAPTSRRSR